MDEIEAFLASYTSAFGWEAPEGIKHYLASNDEAGLREHLGSESTPVWDAWIIWNDARKYTAVLNQSTTHKE